MYYITVKQNPAFRQMTLEEFLFGSFTNLRVNTNENCTRTYKREAISGTFKGMMDEYKIINSLCKFNDKYKELASVDRKSLYKTFYIPKKTGGLREINAPEPELMSALRELKYIFEDKCTTYGNYTNDAPGNKVGALYHTSAFAYIKGRSTLDAVKRHQANESRWFGKYDLSKFFNNTTIDYVMHMFSMVFPFCEIIKSKYSIPDDGFCEFKQVNGCDVLRTALELAFLNGELPQGTPISPLITNIMMIPVDYELTKALRSFNNQPYIYTRYADDFIISSKYDFNVKDVEKLIVDTLASFDAPFTINSNKTRYGSSAGRNWNLGVMLNKDNNITIGHKKKKHFQAMLFNYAMDKKNNKPWELNDVQTMEGYRNYYHMVEGDPIDEIVKSVSEKTGIDIISCIKEDLKC